MTKFLFAIYHKIGCSFTVLKVLVKWQFLGRFNLLLNCFFTFLEFGERNFSTKVLRMTYVTGESEEMLY